MVRLDIDKFTRGVYLRLGLWILSVSVVPGWAFRLYNDTGAMDTRILWWGRIGPIMFDVVLHRKR